MPALPRSDTSLLVRTDFASDDAWQQVIAEAQRENEDGFRAYLELVNDPAFDRLNWQAVKATVPVNENGASVLFIADGTTLTLPYHPILVVDLGISGKSPFRCVAPELWGVENNLNISNMDWDEFANAVEQRRYLPWLRRVGRSQIFATSPVTAHRHDRSSVPDRLGGLWARGGLLPT